MGRKDYSGDVVTFVNNSPEFIYQSAWGEKFVREGEQISAGDMVGRIVFNKSKNITGVLRALAHGSSRGGHGEPDWEYTKYGLVTKDYDISHLSSGDIVQFV